MTYNNKILIEDLMSIVNSQIDFAKFKGKTFIVTGATGLIGSLFIKTVFKINDVKNLDIKVIAIVRDIEKYNDVFKDFITNKNLSVICCDIREIDSINYTFDYVIHAASVTSSAVMTEKPVEMIETSVVGTNNLLRICKDRKIGCFLYISSMESYGTFDDDIDYVYEDNYGYIDTLSVRSDYPLSKRMCENLCIAYSKEFNVPIKVARLAQTFGPGVSINDSRIYMQFAKSCIENKDIVLHTDGTSEGNYCYTIDAIKALFYIILYGNNNEAYNVVNESSHMTINDMAKLVIDKIANNNISLIHDIKMNNSYAQCTRMKLSGKKLYNIGFRPEVSLVDSYKRLIEYING